MKTVIVLDDVPFEGFENANFTVSLFKLFEDFGIPRENISINSSIGSRQYTVDGEHVWDSLTDLVKYLGNAGFKGGVVYLKGIRYRDSVDKEWKKLI